MIPTCVRVIVLPSRGHGQLGRIQVHDSYLCERYRSPNWRPWLTRQKSGAQFLLSVRERYCSPNWRAWPTCGIQVHDSILCAIASKHKLLTYLLTTLSERCRSFNWRPWPTRQDSGTGTWFLLVWEVSLSLPEAMANSAELSSTALPTGGLDKPGRSGSITPARLNMGNLFSNTKYPSPTWGYDHWPARPG